ncbi:MAG: dihydrodipicolinate synthase family protein [Rhizobiales bacterium]|nr:dihydrodipicolinate synthase family protein [Hyphomicrobiales bacterium]
MQSISGLIVATATPLGEDSHPDIGLMADHVTNLLEDGCHYVAPFGTTGEANSFNADQRIATLRALVDAGVDPARLFPGTGAAALQDAMNITEAALDLGVAGVMILPPFYYPDQGAAGLATYYRPLLARAAKADIPVLFYNIPQLSKVRISLELMDMMRSEFGEVAHGVKDSSGDRAQTDAYLARAADFAIFPGTESLLDVSLEAGGAGCISGPVNLSAKISRAAYEALKGGAMPGHEAVQAMKAIRAAIQKYPLIPAIKYLLAKRYNNDAWHNFLPPLMPLSETDRAKLDADLAATGVWVG